MDPGQLSGRTALIVGASRGIGRASALVLAGAGADVVLVARSEGALGETAELAGQLGARALPLVGDVAEPAVAEKARNLALEEFGRLDILVHSAGTNVPARMLGQITVEDWRRVIDVNLNSAFYFIHAALPALRVQGGTIVNIVSWAVKIQSFYVGAAYTASKLAMLGLNSLVNAEERHFGIRACAIIPGEVNTPILDTKPVPPPPESRAAMLQPSDVAAAVLYAVTSPAHVNVEEITVRPMRLRNQAADFQRMLDDAASRR